MRSRRRQSTTACAPVIMECPRRGELTGCYATISASVQAHRSHRTGHRRAGTGARVLYRDPWLQGALARPRADDTAGAARSRVPGTRRYDPRAHELPPIEAGPARARRAPRLPDDGGRSRGHGQGARAPKDEGHRGRLGTDQAAGVRPSRDLRSRGQPHRAAAMDRLKLETIANHWLARFETALAQRDVALLKSLFHPDSHWRDVLAFTSRI